MVVMAYCPDGLQQPTAVGLKTFLSLSQSRIADPVLGK
jgi:hypothetical protein